MSGDWFQVAKDGDITNFALLLIGSGIDINFTDSPMNDANTALMYAVQNNHVPIVKLLLNEKHLDVNSTNRIGDTALHFAARHDVEGKMTEVLLGHSAIDMYRKNNENQTAVYLAASTGHKECAEKLRSLMNQRHTLRFEKARSFNKWFHSANEGHRGKMESVLKQRNNDLTNDTSVNHVRFYM